MTKKFNWFNWLMWAGVGIGMASAAPAEIPTFQERLANSGLNPSGITWRAETIRKLPTPEHKEGQPWATACYRKDFVLPAKPRLATVTVMPSVTLNYSIMVNGQVVAPPLPGAHSGFRNLDITKFLQAGANVFAFNGATIDRGGMSLVVDGIVFCQDGSTVRLLTDKTWRGGFDLAEGWDRLDAKAAGLSEMQSLGVPRGKYFEINPPYYGPIQIELAGMSQPIFDEEKPVEMGVTLMNARGQTPDARRQTTEGQAREGGLPNPVLTYEIMNEESRQKVTSGTVELKPKDKLDLGGTLKADLLPAGAYRVRLVMTAGTNEVERRDYEIAVVGAIKQREVEGTSYEDGMELKEIWSIDCTAEPKPGEFISWRYQKEPVKTVVRESPIGKYRTLETNITYQAFGYKFKVRNLYVPHLVVVEWPDDMPRRFLAEVYEPTTMIPDEYPFAHHWAVAGFQRADTGFFSTREHPVLSNQMRKEQMIYWPNEEQACVFLYNADGTAAGPVAVARITVYEILNDLPALKIKEPASFDSRRTTQATCGDHLIGYHTERGPQSMSAAYHAGPLGAMFTMRLAGIDYPEFYRDWYATTENMIKRMRFSGQNMYLMGHFMYNGVLYPSKKYIFSPNEYGGADAMRDHGSLILRMFGRNGMKLISNIEYTCTREFVKGPTEQEIRAGAPTYYSVSRLGKVQAGGWMCWVNFHHPVVQESVLTIVDELIDLYKEYPAWGGISLLLSRWFGGPIQFCWYGAKDDPLDWGYEDYTIELFQKETGIEIPDDRRQTTDAGRQANPDRFAKRYDWLMANAKQKWIDWRCAQYTALYAKIRDRLVKARPDLKLYLVNFEPTFSYSARPTKQALDLDGKYDQPEAVKQALKNFGFDLDALRKERSMVVTYGYAAAGSAITYADPRRDYEEVAHDSVWQDLFADDARGGAYIWTGMFHAGYEFPKGAWIFESGIRRQGFPMGRFVNDTFVNVLVRSNPTWMPHTWIDVVDSGGRLHEMRQFARAYRTLPNGKYERLAGNGLDKNIWIEATRVKGVEFAYAANTHWWSLDEVALTFADGVEVHDLIRDQPVKLENGTWRFRLGPYEVQTFRLTGGSRGGSGIRGASSKSPQSDASKAELELRGQLGEARQVAASAHARAGELNKLPAWGMVAVIDALINAAATQEATGNMGTAYDLAMSGKLKQACALVINQVLEAIPLRVIGPFGKPEDTVGAGKELVNPEVVAEFRGMETPYLGEFSGTNCEHLAEGFVPDMTKSWAVYGNPVARWKETVKTEYLTFYGLCHSELPLWMSAYAYTEVFSPSERAARVSGGSDNALWVWVNDRLVLRHGGYGTARGGQRPAMPDQNRGEFTLKSGWNRILVKAVQRGETRVYLRLTDKDGNGLDDLKFRVPAAESI